MAEKLLLGSFLPMYNRLQRYPPPPNIAPANRPTPALRPNPATVVEVEEKPRLQVDFKPAHQKVAIRAYSIFINEGARHGFDLRHWLEAELQLVAEHKVA